MAQHELPFCFNVLARIREPRSSPGVVRLSPMGVMRKTRRTEQLDGIPPGVHRSDVRPRSMDPPQRDPPSHELIIHRMPATNLRDSPQGVQHQEASSSSSPSLIGPSGPFRNTDATPDSFNTTIPHRVINTPRTDGECGPTLTEVNPGSGHITGGARIWLKGVDFPAGFALYARFGTALASTVEPIDLPVTPFLINSLRHSVLLNFLSVLCLP